VLTQQAGTKEKEDRKKGVGRQRRGAVKKAFRGRVKLDLMVIGANKPISVMVVKVEVGDITASHCQQALRRADA
jgi:hypothetical protein